MEQDAAEIIRPYAPGDFDALVAITGEVFGSVSIDGLIEAVIGRAGADWVRVKAQAIRREVSEHPEACFVAQRGGQVVGYVTCTIDRTASRGTIANLAVSRACQGHGLGRRLLARALDHFRAAGLAQAKIETLACNAAGQYLYTSMGFREVVRQIHYVMPLEPPAGQ